MIAPPRTRVTVANMTSKSVPERYVEYLISLAPYMDDPAAALIFATMTTVLRPVEILDDAARLQGGDIVVDDSPMATSGIHPRTIPASDVALACLGSDDQNIAAALGAPGLLRGLALSRSREMLIALHGPDALSLEGLWIMSANALLASVQTELERAAVGFYAGIRPHGRRAQQLSEQVTYAGLVRVTQEIDYLAGEAGYRVNSVVKASSLVRTSTVRTAKRI